jgi:hypothetical protein
MSVPVEAERPGFCTIETRIRVPIVYRLAKISNHFARSSEKKLTVSGTLLAVLASAVILGSA